MECIGEKDETAAEPGEVADEPVVQEPEKPARSESLYGPGVPTAESFADDVPLEWLHEEDGSTSS